MKAKKFKTRPLHDRVIILPEEFVDKIGSIYVPTQEEFRQRPSRGTVMAAGPGTEINLDLLFQSIHEGAPKLVLKSMTVKQGDIVIFGKNAGSMTKIDDVEYLIMRESDILAIL